MIIAGSMWTTTHTSITVQVHRTGMHHASVQFFAIKPVQTSTNLSQPVKTSTHCQYHIQSSMPYILYVHASTQNWESSLVKIHLAAQPLLPPPTSIKPVQLVPKTKHNAFAPPPSPALAHLALLCARGQSGGRWRHWTYKLAPVGSWHSSHGSSSGSLVSSVSPPMVREEGGREIEGRRGGEGRRDEGEDT